MSTRTRVVCAQLALDVTDRAATRAAGHAAIEHAFADGAQIVVLPELANSGYVFADREEAQAAAEHVDGETIRRWSRLAGSTPGGVVIGGFCELGHDGALYNAVAIVTADGVLDVYRKTHLWDREREWFRPGDRLPRPVPTRFGAVAAAICYDAYFPELTRAAALAGAELLALPTNAPRRVSGAPVPPAGGGFPVPIQLSIYATIAHLNGIYVAACDRVGDERGVEWVGASAIIAPDGWPLAGPPPGYRAGLVHAECQLDLAKDKRRGSANDLFADRRPDLYC